MLVFYNTLKSRGPLTRRRPLRGVKTTFVFMNDAHQPALGVEVIVYTLVYKSHIDKLIYVSKADTTGLFPSHAYACVVSLLNWLVSLSPLHLLDSLSVAHWEKPTPVNHNGKFVSHTHFGLHVLLERHRGKSDYCMPVLKKETAHFHLPSITKTRLALFTKPENQYLFPNSHLNKNKHLLDGDALLKWWVSVIEGLDLKSSRKCIDIVGASPSDVQKYVHAKHAWTVGSIFASESHVPAVDCIPLFPDDPKGRFLEHLVVENRIKRVKLSQFWTELSARQEFRIGITVGLLGVDFVDDKSKWHTLDNTKKLSKKEFLLLKNLLLDKDYSSCGNWESLANELRGAFGDLPLLNLPKSTKVSQNVPTPEPTLNVITLKPRSKRKKIESPSAKT